MSTTSIISPAVKTIASGTVSEKFHLVFFGRKKTVIIHPEELMDRIKSFFSEVILNDWGMTPVFECQDLTDRLPGNKRPVIGKNLVLQVNTIDYKRLCKVVGKTYYEQPWLSAIGKYGVEFPLPEGDCYISLHDGTLSPDGIHNFVFKRYLMTSGIQGPFTTHDNGVTVCGSLQIQIVLPKGYYVEATTVTAERLPGGYISLQRRLVANRKSGSKNNLKKKVLTTH